MLFNKKDLNDLLNRMSKTIELELKDYLDISLKYIGIVDLSHVVLILENKYGQFMSLVVGNTNNKLQPKIDVAESIIYNKKIDIKNLSKSMDDIHTRIISGGFYNKNDRDPLDDIGQLLELINTDRTKSDNDSNSNESLIKKNKSQIVLNLFLEKMQNELEPKIDIQKISQLYSVKVSSTDGYPQAFDKTFDVKDIKGDMAQELMIVTVDKDGKESITKPLKIVGVTKKAIGLSDPDQSDQLRVYIPKVQILVRGAYKSKDKIVVIVESPVWLLKNILGRGIKL